MGAVLNYVWRTHGLMSRQTQQPSYGVVADVALKPVGSLTGITGAASPGAFGLTFDDGPDPVDTPGVLQSLDAGDASATFFVLVSRARRHPAPRARDRRGRA